MNAQTILVSRALRHKNMPPVVQTGGSSADGSGSSDSDSGSGSSADSGGSPDSGPSSSDGAAADATMVAMEYLRDEDDEIFVPRTHTRAVQNARGEVLDDILTATETRLAALEQSIAPDIKVADNLLTDSASIALSARQGKVINETYRGILESEDGDVRSDGSMLLIQEGRVTAAMLQEGIVGTATLADGSVTEGKLADGLVSTVKIADAAVTKDKLSAELQTTITDVEDMTEWRTQTDARLDTLERQMQEHITTDALLKEQNQYLLKEHQKMKRLDITASIYNATADANVQTSISWNDIRMSGLVINYRWHFWDQIDSKDYTPDSMRIEALLHSALLDDTGNAVLDEDGSQKYEDSTITLSTDTGLNDLDEQLKLRALNAGSTVTIKSTVSYCWLDWTNEYKISITA